MNPTPLFMVKKLPVEVRSEACVPGTFPLLVVPNRSECKGIYPGSESLPQNNQLQAMIALMETGWQWGKISPNPWYLLVSCFQEGTITTSSKPCSALSHEPRVNVDTAPSISLQERCKASAKRQGHCQDAKNCESNDTQMLKMMLNNV